MDLRGIRGRHSRFQSLAITLSRSTHCKELPAFWERKSRFVITALAAIQSRLMLFRADIPSRDQLRRLELWKLTTCCLASGPMSWAGAWRFALKATRFSGYRLTPLNMRGRAILRSQMQLPTRFRIRATRSFIGTFP